MFASQIFSQNITNTLGTSGLFSIKDATSNYLTLSQLTGQVNILRSLRLENTIGSGIGVLFKGTERFLHNYQAPLTNGYNTFVGINSGNFTMTGPFSSASSNNTGVGHSTLFNLTIGNNNTAVGSNSLFSNTEGYSNTGIGGFSLNTNTTGYQNTALGSQSLFSNTTGAFNTALGYQSLYSNNEGFGNTAIGYQSLFSNSSGVVNLAIGLFALSDNNIGSLNTALGNYAGSTVTTGSNLTLVGYAAQPTSGSSSNQITLGDGNVTSLRCNVTTITSLSDMRDKKNIKDLSLGIDFLMKVKPRLFNWDKREWYENNISDGSKMKEAPTAGFIAQELDKVQTSENAGWLNLVLKDNPEKLEATYGNLLPVMVKAIQELKVESEKLKVKSQNLEIENTELKRNNKEMEQMFLKLEQTQNKLISELEKFKLKENNITEVKTGEQK